MARGRSRGHKGGRKQFSSADQIKDDLAKQEEKRKWREAHPDSESEESEEEAKPVRRGGGRVGDKGSCRLTRTHLVLLLPFPSSLGSREKKEKKPQSFVTKKKTPSF